MNIYGKSIETISALMHYIPGYDKDISGKLHYINGESNSYDQKVDNQLSIQTKDNMKFTISLPIQTSMQQDNFLICYAVTYLAKYGNPFKKNKFIFEKNINRFDDRDALNLLLPYAILNDYCIEYKNDIERIAYIFNVNPDVIERQILYHN